VLLSSGARALLPRTGGSNDDPSSCSDAPHMGCNVGFAHANRRPGVSNRKWAGWSLCYWPKEWSSNAHCSLSACKPGAAGALPSERGSAADVVPVASGADAIAVSGGIGLKRSLLRKAIDAIRKKGPPPDVGGGPLDVACSHVGEELCRSGYNRLLLSQR